MTSTTRTALSVAIFLGIVTFFLSSAILAGPFALPTLIAFGLLVPYNLIGLASLCYSGSGFIKLRAKQQEVAVPAQAIAATVGSAVKRPAA